MDDEAALAHNVPGFKGTLMKIDAAAGWREAGFDGTSTPPLSGLVARSEHANVAVQRHDRSD